MKKIVFSIVASMLISLCAAQAQEYDTTGRARNDQQDRQRSEQTRQQRDQKRQQREQAQQQQSDRRQNQNAYTNQGMVMIEKNELPEPVKQTLQKDKYEGWENATIYHNTNTGEYVIAPRAHRFDAQGNEIEGVGYGRRNERQNRYPEDRSQSDQATQQRSYDQSEQTQAEEQSSQSQQQSNAYRNDQSPEDQAKEQQPSSSYRTEQDNQSSRQIDRQPQSQYRSEDMVEIQAEQIPDALRRTLNGSLFDGWEENGTLYQHPPTGEYVLILEKTDDSSQPKVYHFDKTGELKDDQTRSRTRNDGQ